MKQTLFFFLLFWSCLSQLSAQSKWGSRQAVNEIEGTEYIIVATYDYPKLWVTRQGFLFVNTRTGEVVPADFPEDTYFRRVSNLKADSLGINKLLITAHTIPKKEAKSPSWGDLCQIFILSVDGKEKVQLTENSFSVHTWEFNQTTGVLLVVGYEDVNGNKKQDKNEKFEMLLYSLTDMELKHRMPIR